MQSPHRSVQGLEALRQPGSPTDDVLEMLNTAFPSKGKWIRTENGQYAVDIRSSEIAVVDLVRTFNLNSPEETFELRTIHQDGAWINFDLDAPFFILTVSEQVASDPNFLAELEKINQQSHSLSSLRSTSDQIERLLTFNEIPQKQK